jgi:hypothetical protein
VNRATRRAPWLGRLRPRQAATAAFAGLFLLGAVVAGLVGGARVGAEAWTVGGVLAPICAPAGGHTAPGTPDPGHGDHGICALCAATGCVAGLGGPPLVVPLPHAAVLGVAFVAPLREPSRRRLVHWDARPRAPPRSA